MRIEVTRPIELVVINDIVHDCFFDLEPVLAQTGSTREIVVELDANHFLYEASRTQFVLQVRGVMRTRCEDTERVGSYDINVLRYKDSAVIISTGIPLVLTFLVEGLALALFDAPNSRGVGPV